MKSHRLPIIASLLLFACASPPSRSHAEARSTQPTTQAPAAAVSSDLITRWDERVIELARNEDGLLTLKGVRTAAMMHLAMHDVASALWGRYEPYSMEPAPSASGLSADDSQRALEAAAFAVVVDQFPDQRAVLEADLRHQPVDEGITDRPVELGRRAAASVLASREGDGWDTEAEYRWHPMGPGVYAEFEEHSGTPKGFVFGAGWAKARPFSLSSPSQFRSPPPPDVSSDAYSVAFHEVKDVGRFDSRTRSADQTHLALWWKDFAENSQNRLARQLVAEHGLDVVDTARLFALLNVSLFDAYVNVFDNKFEFNHWRPYTAIRWAENDGNPDTEADPDWDNLHHHTYAFPSYPSAHGAVCAAAMTVLADTLGDQTPFTMTTREVDIAGPFSGKMTMDPVTRSFDSFSDAAMECALSRVYLGIHFRYDSVEGNRLGARVGHQVIDNLLPPRRSKQ
ncbi:MAG: vanadium-dependent haloperoxidase [Thermoanaerobaculia bacterium]|nr:vanadium-dependent haloperoxidase [Thermoanaerobaculia bacterium]